MAKYYKTRNRPFYVTIGSGLASIGIYAFDNCESLTAVYFQGNSPTPTNDLTVFYGDTPGTVYYLSTATGWGSMFDGWPTMSNVVSSAVGSVTEIHGKVQVTHPDGSTAILQQGDPIMEGDVVETDQHGAVNVTFQDNSSFAISPNAKVAIDEYVYDPGTETGKSNFSLLRGLFLYTSGLIGHNDPDAKHFHTVYGSIGDRGTQFIVQPDACASGEEIYLIEGELAITPTNTPGVTNICDAPVTILLTASSVTTNALDQATYDSISNSVFQVTNTVTFSSWIAQYYCTNDPTASANADPDGDGRDNYAEFLAGTDPSDSASYFHILPITPQGNNLSVSWLCGGGRTNVLQSTTNLGASWVNVTTNIMAGVGDSVTNYLDFGAVTNAPARFYRVQLVQ